MPPRPRASSLCSARTTWSRSAPAGTSSRRAFVDEPRRAVKGADRLVTELIEQVAQSFAGEREALERQWGTGGEASTEDLRVALRRYRAFFERLLAS